MLSGLWAGVPDIARSGFVLAIAVAVALTAYSFLGELDNVLAGMHGPRHAAYRMADLASSSKVFDTWNSYSRTATNQLVSASGETIPHQSPRRVIYTYQGVDAFVFIPAYAVAVFIVLVRIQRRRSRIADDDENSVSLLCCEWLVMLATGALIVLVAVDYLEDILTILVVHTRNWYLPAALTKVTLLKWVAVAFVALGLIVSGIWTIRLSPRDARPSFKHLRYLRGQLLLVFAFILGLHAPGPLAVLSNQSQDEIRRWLADWWMVLPAALATLWFSALLGISGRHLLSLPAPQLGAADSRRRLGKTAAFIVGAAGLGLVIAGKFSRFSGLWIPGAIALVLLAVSVAIHFINHTDPTAQADEAPSPDSIWPRALAALPLIALGLGVFKAGGIDYAYFGERHLLQLMALGIALEVAGLVVAGVDRLRALRGPLLWLFAGISAAIAVYLTVRIERDVWVSSTLLGTIGVVGVYMSVATLVIWLLMWIVERTEPPSALVVLGFRRIPVFTLIAIWALVAVRFATNPSYHDARVADLTAPWVYPPLTADQVFAAWQGAQPTDKPKGGRRVLPLLMVAASGGGIRAAYWTDVSLDCLLWNGPEGVVCSGPRNEALRLAPPMRRSVLAASGASGGSVGLAEYAAHTRTNQGGTGWVDRALGADYVAPTVARWLFADIPQEFIGWPRTDDRATVLEQSWERSWLKPQDVDWKTALWSSGGTRSTQADSSGDPLSKGLLATWFARQSKHPPGWASQVPLLLLNGTSVENGCKFETSALGQTGLGHLRGTQCLVPDSADAAAGLAGTTLLRSYLACPGVKGGTQWDLRLSTAGLLSARFPYVSPSGRVTSQCSPAPNPTFVVDGGYYDNSGASSLTQIWSTIAPRVEAYNNDPKSPGCIVPIMIQLDNHYASTSPPPSNATAPVQSLVPPETLANVRNAQESAATLVAAQAIAGAKLPQDLSLQGDVPRRRFFDIVPVAHPGAEAPLGWALSPLSQQDLTAEVSEGRNANQIRALRRWFDPELRCVPAK